MQGGLRLSEGQASRLTACQVHLPGRIAILLVCVYGYYTEGLTEDNLALLQCVALLVRTVGLPTMVGGDFNLTVEQITETHFLTNSGLSFISLNQTTCLEGQGHCLDQFLSSPASSDSVPIRESRHRAFTPISLQGAASQG